MADNIGIDVIFPIGSMDWLPYLRNSCRFIRNQNYQTEMIGIIISYLYNKEENTDDLVGISKEFNALVFSTKGSYPEAFETPLARNVGARNSQRQVLAFIDCDVALHPDTFKIAASFLHDGNCAVVIPVADMDDDPESDVFKISDPGVLKDRAEKFGRPRFDAMGALMVPRDIVFKIHGYDERMRGWGGDDTDFSMRIERSGYKLHKIENHGCPRAMHQRHGTSSRESEFTFRNRRILSGSPDCVRNIDSWGGIKS